VAYIPKALGKALKLVVYLQRQLARGHHDEHAALPRHEALVYKRDQKRGRFAGAGVGDAHDVGAAQHVRDRAVLDGRGLGVALVGDVLFNALVERKVGKAVLGDELLYLLGNDRLVDEFGYVRKYLLFVAAPRAAPPY
jgi:hypothetical protein